MATCSAGYTPFSPLASMSVSMSDARILASQLQMSGSAASIVIAMLYGSSPLEQPALQMRRRRGRPVRLDAERAGRTTERRNAKWCASRKNSVLLVVMALIIRTSSCPSGSSSIRCR